MDCMMLSYVSVPEGSNPFSFELNTVFAGIKSWAEKDTEKKKYKDEAVLMFYNHMNHNYYQITGKKLNTILYQS